MGYYQAANRSSMEVIFAYILFGNVDAMGLVHFVNLLHKLIHIMSIMNPEDAFT